MYTRLVSSLVFPLHERVKRHDTVALRRQLERSQWWSPERIRALTGERLRAFLVDAGTHVPYYRTLFDEVGFEPSAVTGAADLHGIPFLTKVLIRANTEALRHEKARRLARSNTGGSSGEPLIFFVGPARVSHDVAAKWRATRWWNVDIGDRETVVWGSPIELGAQDLLRRMRDRILRTELLPAFQMSESRLDEFVDSIRRRRPRMLFGYPSALTHLARHAERRGVRLDNLGIEIAFVTAERLYDDQRSAISRVFGCGVANGYGGRDAGFVAHECPEGGMHVSAEDIVVELVGPDGVPVPPGVPGEVVVTHLASGDFPFIRYRTGDIAVHDDRPCRCGRGLPLLREIQGRSTDFVVAADGTVMHGLALIYVVRDVPGVDSFKIVQETRQATTVSLVVNDRFDPAAQDRIVAGFKQRLGAAVDVKLQLVPHLVPERSGKYRYVVSHAMDAQ